MTVQSTTDAPTRTRRAKSVYQFKALDLVEAKQRMRLPFLPETAYRVMLGELDLGIVVYHVIRGIARDWMAEDIRNRYDLRKSFTTRELAAKALRLKAEREHRI